LLGGRGGADAFGESRRLQKLDEIVARRQFVFDDEGA
jgi:hypothetical protein